MPELPEVETIARQLRPYLVGRIITAVELDGSSVFRYPGSNALAAELPGKTIDRVERRGKFLGLGLRGGRLLVFHLGMTGHLVVAEASGVQPKHLHLTLQLDNGAELRFDDSRRFGRVVLGDWDELTRVGAIPQLGLEPNHREFSRVHLANILWGSSQALKSVLLDQGKIAGLGNIYVDESCWRARVNPARASNGLSQAEVNRLHRSIRLVLGMAISSGGSSIDDYRDAWGGRGKMQEQLRVFGQTGTACPRCGTGIVKTVVGGRGTHFCPRCQPRAG